MYIDFCIDFRNESMQNLAVQMLKSQGKCVIVLGCFVLVCDQSGSGGPTCLSSSDAELINLELGCPYSQNILKE